MITEGKAVATSQACITLQVDKPQKQALSILFLKLPETSFISTTKLYIEHILAVKAMCFKAYQI